MQKVILTALAALLFLAPTVVNAKKGIPSPSPSPEEVANAVKTFSETGTAWTNWYNSGTEGRVWVYNRSRKGVKVWVYHESDKIAGSAVSVSYMAPTMPPQAWTYLSAEGNSVQAWTRELGDIQQLAKGECYEFDGKYFKKFVAACKQLRGK